MEKMNKFLLELQKGCNATCAIISTSEYKELIPSVAMNANVSDKFLFGSGVPPFADKLDAKAKQCNVCYFIIYGLDTLSIDAQNRYVGLVKDREMNGYNLPRNVVVVFTVDGQERLNKVSAELYHFAVVAI